LYIHAIIVGYFNGKLKRKSAFHPAAKATGFSALKRFAIIQNRNLGAPSNKKKKKLYLW